MPSLKAAVDRKNSLDLQSVATVWHWRTYIIFELQGRAELSGLTFIHVVISLVGIVGIVAANIFLAARKYERDDARFLAFASATLITGVMFP
jgi:hypothetical protein